MWVNALLDSGPLRRKLANLPNDFRGKGLIGAPTVDRAENDQVLGLIQRQYRRKVSSSLG